MDLKRIDNLWRFLCLKNNLTPQHQVGLKVSYAVRKGTQRLIHQFNPKLLLDSSLYLEDVKFQENLVHRTYQAQRRRFGIKQKTFSPASTAVFFPNELLKLGLKFDLEVRQDRHEHYSIRIGPFNPKNIYDILDTVNLISRTFWVKNFFAEGIRN
ncbi:hypothetical protein SAMN06295967_10336 [Belliella buryatensis]|uniref:Uncharacterized protein n=1 Tax=Belliella buryatensis TaxID=1500549 RepID=A0A239BKR3_9BACT|nr:hypothetical protein [Belliella buryatensis]SNS07958.1 hypothetical protein SAMN06295967_10336 [Belliella buryatensis]